MAVSSHNGGGQRPTLYANAHLFCPASGRDGPGAVLVENGLIADIGSDVGRGDGAVTVDCQGHWLIPGLIDMCVTTGEPGHEHRETLATAGQAAAAGGVTTMVCQPNTNPVIDDVALVDYLERRARDTADVRVHTMAALTKGLSGEEMTEIGLLREAGAVAFTDGPRSIANARVMRRAMCYARDFDALIVHHVEDRELSGEGVMNEGEVATRLGLAGIPAAAEVTMIERDIRLVELTGARYHAALVSTAQSVDVIRRAKERGLPVTCGVSAAHLALNDNDIGAYRTFFKLSPPLRSEADRKALVAGLADGTIDVIVSAHDPQDPDTKRHPFAEAANGAIGLETLLPAALMLHHEGLVPLARLIDAVTARPAALMGVRRGRLEAGMPADLALVDLDRPWVLEIDALRSKSKNTPFEGRRLQGRALATIVAGRQVYQMDAVA